MAPPPLRRYGLRWVTEKERKKWFKEHKESKYSHDMFIDRNFLSLVFPHMVDRILTLGLGFVFDALDDCNLNMVREFLANWMPKERSNQVKIRGKIIEFSPMDLNRLLGTPHVNPQPFVNMVKKTLYRDIRHTLCGPNSVAQWTLHQQFGYHVSLPYAHLSREARVWLKIVCASLVPRKNVTDVTRKRLRMNGVTKEQLQQLNIDYPLRENSRALCRVGPKYEDPLDDDVSTEDEMARVDSDLESSDDNEEASNMGEVSLAPTDDEE
ncbi:hypothetical protein HAX54_000810 [Datura stramonium]|uniref:Putative plant transposon protein domain-containing protein n=1 Tax=Datura stramonium TaxID=4076 RepID=A0ABS8WSZ5_DATST|nr:hypothetical protein [Datura stramonium]